MNTLSALHLQLIDRLRDSELDWWTPARLATELQWDVERTTDLLADLDVAGRLRVSEGNQDIWVALADRVTPGGSSGEPRSWVHWKYRDTLSLAEPGVQVA